MTSSTLLQTFRVIALTLSKLVEIWISHPICYKNNLRGIRMGIGPIWGSSSLTPLSSLGQERLRDWGRVRTTFQSSASALQCHVAYWSMSFLQLLSLLLSNTEQRGLCERSWFEIRAFICRQLRKLFSSCQVAHKASSLCLPQPAFSAAVLCTLFNSFKFASISVAF